MSFRISGLPVARFHHLFGLSDEELMRQGVIRYRADANPGFPDRIELRDADVGESLLLVNYEHQSAATPYRARHAIFVLESARGTYDRIDEVPHVFRSRTLSLRAYDENHMMIDAELCGGQDAESAIERLFSTPDVSYLHAHYAKRGCYAARIDRA